MSIGKITSQPAEVSFLKSLNSAEMPSWDKGMKALSFSIYPVMPASVIGTWTYGYYKKDKIMLRNAYKSAITIGLAAFLSTGLKYAVNRPRPSITYPNDIIARTHSGVFSFPSGHTTTAFATATALSLSHKKWSVAIPSYLYAASVAYSRMRLGVHYPSDVLAASVLGIGSGFLIWKVDRVLLKRKSKRNVVKE